MIITINKPYIQVGKRSESLLIRDGTNIKKVPVRHVESLVMVSKGQISHDALLLLSQHGIPVFYIYKGKPMSAYIPFAHHGFVITRKAQFDAYTNNMGLEFMKKVVLGALDNKKRILQYFSRNRRAYKPLVADILDDKAKSIQKLMDSVVNISISGMGMGEARAKFRSQLMGHEGAGSRLYFGALKEILPEELGFKGRNRRPPRDPVNAVISFGNHLLANEVMMAIVAAGLEPYAGFLHSDRSGRASLVYDLMEEFRQPIVDRLMVRLFQRQLLQNEDFEIERVEKVPGSKMDEYKNLFEEDSNNSIVRDEISNQYGSIVKGVKFTEKGLQRFLTDFYYYVRKDGEKIKGKHMTYQQIILRQARMLVRYFLGKESEYIPYHLNL